jgi:hypothetical protein
MPFRATGVAAALAIVFSGVAHGAEISAAEAKALKAKVSEQAKRMEALKKQLADTDAKLQSIQQALGVDAPAKTVAAATPAKGKEAPPVQVAQAPTSPRYSNSPACLRLPASSPSRLACCTRTRRAIGCLWSATPSFRQ